ncbi:hypothetical protein HDU79_005706 [Rhizoclosmatium sp. JEL0117]|nr:hypothetical protein HDU79_005706 [Rhizoclosmatium sp. JEL0117]
MEVNTAPSQVKATPFQRIRNHKCCSGKRFFVWIVCVSLFLVGAALALFFLFPRFPTSKLRKIHLDSLEINNVHSATAHLLVDLTIGNPNYISVNVQKLSFNVSSSFYYYYLNSANNSSYQASNPAYASGAAPFASGIDAIPFTMPARGDVNITVPLNVTYDSRNDPKLKFLGQVTGQCALGLLGNTSATFTADIFVITEAIVLGSIRVYQETFLQQQIGCPPL